VTLCVAPSSNLATGVYSSWRDHPLPRLAEAGVAVCLAADDPTIFSTSTAKEYERAGRELSLDAAVLEQFRRTAWDARFPRT